MNKTFDTYGVDAVDLEAARAMVEAAVPVRFVLHESMFWGGDYYLSNSVEFGKLVIRRNHNSYTGELNEPDHPGWTIYVSANEPPDPEAMRRRLISAGLTFLNRAVV
jgi:hypothetical protein